MLLHYARRQPADESNAREFAAGLPGPGSASSEPPFPCQTIVRFLPRAEQPAQQTGAKRPTLPPHGKIRGLILDADLLVSNTAAWCRELSLLLAHVGCDGAADLQHRLWRNRCLAEAFRGRRELGDCLDAFLHTLPLSRGRRDEVLAASLAQWREVQSALRPLPGVRKTLRRLAALGAKLAMVSDSASCGAELATQLSAAGLGDVFAAVVTSVDVDCVLPDAEVYRIATARLGLSSAETLCVAETSALCATGATNNCAADGSHMPAEQGWHIGRLDDLTVLFDSFAELARAG